jgi:hypothetical protein
MSDFLRTLATPISPVLVQITNTAPAAYRPAGEPVAPGAQQQNPMPPTPYLNADGSLTNLGVAVLLVRTVSAGASAYHGYKRNKSVGWAVAWGFFGGAFPIVVPAIALAQGFAKPESK